MALVIEKSKLDAAFEKKFGKKAPASYMFAVRGSLPTKSGSNVISQDNNKPWINNDAVGIVYSGGVKMFKGTVEPSYEWTEKSKKSGYPGRGVYHLSDGLHRAFKGLHKGYEAFRIIDAKGWRDRNQNFVFDASDVHVTVVSGINIHKGSSGDWIGIFSAGCTNVIASQWPTFKKLGYDVLPQTFGYWLVSFNVLEDLFENLDPVKIYVNDVEFDSDVNAWVDGGTTKVEVRPFLNQLLYNGELLKWKYQPSPRSIMVWLKDDTKIIPMGMSGNRGVLGLASFIGAIDPGAEVKWDAKDRSVRIESQILKHTPLVSVATIMSYEIMDGQEILRWDDISSSEETAI